MDEKVKTPCIGICSTVYGDEICRGCQRTYQEVIQWNALSEEEKLKILKRIEGQSVRKYSAKILRRPIDLEYQGLLIKAGVPEALAKIMAARPRHMHLEITASFSPKLNYLTPPQGLKNFDLAVDRLVQAITEGEVIGIETDHDCDGQTSHAVIYLALRDFCQVPENKIKSYIGHRMKEGYGLSNAVCERILNDPERPSVLITADNGSADEPRISKLKNLAGIDTIVTDHHEVPKEGPPQSAYACLNPTQEDCAWGDVYIAGCMVAWLFMAGVYGKLKKIRNLENKSLENKNLASLLDFVAVGTIADCVSLSRSVNNRVVVQAGLEKLNKFERPCWQAIRPLLKNPKVTPSDCGFLIGPMLNSDGRLSDAFGSVNFLLANSVQEAMPWARSLYLQNQERKKIQKKMTDSALEMAAKFVSAGYQTLVLFLAEGHAGVHGISASRIKDYFGRPVILFSPKEGEPELITGSARSIDGVHLKKLLDQVAEKKPGVLLKHGGHKGAAGVLIKKNDFEVFKDLFEEIFCEYFKTNQSNHTNKYSDKYSEIEHIQIGPVIWTDGLLTPELVNLNFLDELKLLEPFGREFEAPLFEIEGKILAPRKIGKEGDHLQCQLALSSGEIYPAVYFNYKDQVGDEVITEGAEVRAIVELADNYFKGRSLQILIRYWIVGS